MLNNFNYEHSYNLEIQTATNGRDAVDICKINNYDIIFMDVNMPGIDGCIASKMIKLNNFKGVITWRPCRCGDPIT